MREKEVSGRQYPNVAAIDARLAALEAERAHLLVQRAEIKASEAERIPVSEELSPGQKVAIFRGLFRGRTDVFATRWQNQQGRSGYSVACNNEWVPGVCNKPRIKCQDCNHRQFTELNDDVVYRHLAGQKIVGLYPLLHDNTCYFLAADFDKSGWRDDVKAMSRACSEFGVAHAIEISRSGNGAHLWIFFSDNIPAREARSLGFGLLDKAMEICPNLSFDSYDRLFPNQDILPEGGFGNLIALPLQKEARLSGNSSFVDAELELIQNQWQYLAGLKSLSAHDVNRLLAILSPSLDLGAEQALPENIPPWELTAKPKPLTLINLAGTLTITLANHIYFNLSDVPGPLIARLRRLASFSNPVFFKTQALRFSTHGIPRFITCARIELGYLALPRGCLDDVVTLLNENKIAFEFDDKRQVGEKLRGMKAAFRLRKSQQAAISALVKYDTGILHAPTAFGKTVTAIGMIAKRKTNTLILVHSRQLLDQWVERLRSFLPDVKIGIIGGGQKKPSGVIDIATYQSLIDKKDNSVSTLVQDYGHVVVDECHHVSAPRYEMVLNEVRAKYLLGLTATPERQDGHQKIIFMITGPIRHSAKKTQEDTFTQEVQVHQLYHPMPECLLQAAERPKISDVYRWIMENDDRTQLIVASVLESIQQSRHPIVLTERREHAESINAILLEKGIQSVVLKGAMRAAERRSVENNLATAQVVVATGKYAGEGFDLPRLDTLYLAMPIAWKGALAQYAGRIHREIDGKTNVTIHDYADFALPMLQRMFKKREKSYKAMGYKISYGDG